MIQGDLATPGVRAVVGDVVDIPLDCLAIGPWHVRAHEGDDLTDLAASLASPTGQIEPIIVRSLDSSPVPGQFQVVAGSRRVRAARLAGLDSIRAVIRNVTEQASARLLSSDLARLFLLRLALLAFGGAALPLTGYAVLGFAAAFAGEILGRYLFFVSVVPKNMAMTFFGQQREAA